MYICSCSCHRAHSQCGQLHSAACLWSAHRCACDVLLLTNRLLVCGVCGVSLFGSSTEYLIVYQLSTPALCVTPFATCPSTLPLALPHSCLSLYVPLRLVSFLHPKCFPDCYCYCYRYCYRYCYCYCYRYCYCYCCAVPHSGHCCVATFCLSVSSMFLNLLAPELFL